MKRFISVLLTVCLLMTMLPTAFAEGETVVAKIGDAEYSTIANAIAAANTNEDADTITLLKDITLSEKLTISSDITITGNVTITRADTYTGTLFVISSGATLTLDGGLIIDGGNVWTFNEETYKKALNREISTTWNDLITSETDSPNANAAMFIVEGSVVANNVTVQNNYSTKDSNGGDGGIFKVDANANLTMNGAKIKHIATGGANSVAHLSTNSTWTINDDTVITDTFAGKNGGVCRNDSGKIIMNGGEISKNRAYNTNGTVFMLYKGSFEMNGGLICSNSGVEGVYNSRCCAIYLHSNGQMTMNGGEICHNTGGGCGGVDSVGSTAKLIITDGFIGNNISMSKNETADIRIDSGKAEISGGTFTQDVTDYCAIGYESIYDENGDDTWTVKQITSVKFDISPADSEIKITTADGTEIIANEDGTYTLYANEDYVYTVSRDGYYSKTETFSVKSSQTISISLTEIHYHDISDEWTSDKDGHWHICSGCDEKLDLAEHTASNWIVKEEATLYQNGLQYKECTECGYIIVEEEISQKQKESKPLGSGVLTAINAASTRLTITASAGEGGRITPEGAKSVIYGSKLTYAIFADAGYEIENVVVDGEDMVAISSYTFKNIRGNHEISVTFKKIA